MYILSQYLNFWCIKECFGSDCVADVCVSPDVCGLRGTYYGMITASCCARLKLCCVSDLPSLGWPFLSSDLSLLSTSFPISSVTSLSLASVSCFLFISISLSSAPGGKPRSLALLSHERGMWQRGSRFICGDSLFIYLWRYRQCL